MTYAEAIAFLYDLRWFGAKFGLANTLKLASLAGNPQDRLRFIHVAGTNGKGSTCAMLESIYRASGLRVGLFTSPHLVAFGERIQVNRQNIAEDEVVKLTEEIRPMLVLAEFPPEEHPTFFEVVTVMALRHFVARQCELVIWETGLGGRLDATNIVTPLASVITNVDYDHQKWLGETIASIAVEKAGIIKPGVPVVTAAEHPEALPVIADAARRIHAPLTLVTQAQADLLQGIDLALVGKHQRLNAAVAIATTRELAAQIPVQPEALRDGLANVAWPGRLQLIARPAGPKFLLDGAHNLAGAESLAAAVRDLFPGAGLTLVLGVLEDKNWRGICHVLAPLARRILLVPVSSERSAVPEELRQACAQANPSAETLACGSLTEAIGKTHGERLVVVTGSLYLVGEALELLGAGNPERRGERGLNEWGAKKTV